MKTKYDSLLIAHGAIILFLGLTSGFFFLFSLLGEISLWPIPGSIKFQMPADDRAWRAAHVGNILNALMLIGSGLALTRVRLSEAQQKWVYWGLLIAGYGNFGFYIGSALGATGRGLSFGPNRFGGGDLLSTFTFLVAYPGAITAPIAMILLARGGFAAAREG